MISMVNRKSAVIITLMFILGIFLSPLFSLPVEAESSTQIDIKPSKDHLEVNENFYATMLIVPDEPIISVQIDLSFDATLLQCDSVSNGNTSAWQFSQPGTIDNINGEITGACVTNMGGTVTNPTDCFNITFTAQYTDGISTLDVHNVGMSNGTGDDIPSSRITVNDGSVTIGAGAPPVFSSENPSDGATDVSIDLSELNVTIEDQEGDNFDWYIGTNPDIGNDSNSGDSNGTKICSISGLDYDTSYTWYVNAVDSGNSIWTNQTFTFTTESNPNQGGTGGGTGGDTDEGEDKEEVEANFSWTKDGLTVNFEDKSKGSVSKWSWDFNGDQEIDSNQQNPTYKYKKVGTYQVTLKVSSDESQDTTTKNVLVFVGNYPPSKPTLKGNETGIQNKQYNYSAKSTDQDGHFVKYTFNWDDGTTTKTEYLASGTEVEKTHKWTNAGKYQIWVQATDDYNNDNGTLSGKTYLVVFIDATLVNGEINGLLIDEDSNGHYDKFNNSETGKETVLGEKDDSYLIDSDNDGEWDYIYSKDEGLSEYGESGKDQDTPGFELLTVLFVITLIMIWKREKVVF